MSNREDTPKESLYNKMDLWNSVKRRPSHNRTKRTNQITKKTGTSKTRYYVVPIRSITKLSLFTTLTIPKLIKMKDQEANTSVKKMLCDGSIFSKSARLIIEKTPFGGLSLFIKKIKEIRQNINKMSDNIKYEIRETKISITKLNELKDTPWVSPELTLNNLDYEVIVSWENNNLYFKTTVEKFNKIKKRLPILIKMMNYIKLQSKKQTPITIYYVLSDLKKQLEKDTIIAPKHINSGYTDLLTNDIFIWREEEFEKITFHELIHLFHQDHTNERISLPVKINGPKSFYESVTDFKAIIYNIIYNSLVMNIKIEIILKNEVNFINNQAKMILNHLNTTNCTQKSPAYAYYIFKCKIFNYFTSDNFDEELFNDIFVKNINFNKLVKLIKDDKINETHFIDYNTARMSLYEME